MVIHCYIVVGIMGVARVLERQRTRDSDSPVMNYSDIFIRSPDEARLTRSFGYSVRKSDGPGTLGIYSIV